MAKKDTIVADFIVNTLSQEEFDRADKAGELSAYEIYGTPDTTKERLDTLESRATSLETKTELLENDDGVLKWDKKTLLTPYSAVSGINIYTTYTTRFEAGSDIELYADAVIKLYSNSSAILSGKYSASIEARSPNENGGASSLNLTDRNFVLVAKDFTTIEQYELRGQSDGTLTWNGKEAPSWGMPNDLRIVNLTVGASGAIYTAPANGYFAAVCDDAASVVTFTGNGLEVMSRAVSGYPSRGFVPCKKNGAVFFNYTKGSGTVSLHFIYAVGEN